MYNMHLHWRTVIYFCNGGKGDKLEKTNFFAIFLHLRYPQYIIFDILHGNRIYIYVFFIIDNIIHAHLFS